MLDSNTTPSAHQPYLGGQRVEVVVKSSIPKELVAANVEAAFARDLPRFHLMDGLGKATGPVAIIGGGPSLKTQMGALRDFPGPKIGCGSVNDFLVYQHVEPEYHLLCDPDPVMAKFVTWICTKTNYLVASQCHADVFDAIKNTVDSDQQRAKVLLWHATVVDMETNQSIADFRGEPTISGGDAAVLRAWPLAAVMGFRDFHFFGFDCSFPPDCESQHAYAYGHDREDPIGVTVDHTGERFITTPGWIAQMNAFTRMLAMSHGQEFTVTIHGESLVASMCCKPRQ